MLYQFVRPADRWFLRIFLIRWVLVDSSTTLFLGQNPIEPMTGQIDQNSKLYQARPEKTFSIENYVQAVRDSMKQSP